ETARPFREHRRSRIAPLNLATRRCPGKNCQRYQCPEHKCCSLATLRRKHHEANNPRLDRRNTRNIIGGEERASDKLKFGTFHSSAIKPKESAKFTCPSFRWFRSRSAKIAAIVWDRLWFCPGDVHGKGAGAAHGCCGRECEAA